MGIRQINNTNNKQSNNSSHRKRSKLQHASQVYTDSTNNSNNENNETSTDQVFQQSINQLRNEIHQLVHDPNTAAYGLLEPRNDIGFHYKPTNDTKQPSILIPDPSEFTTINNQHANFKNDNPEPYILQKKRAELQFYQQSQHMIQKYNGWMNKTTSLTKMKKNMNKLNKKFIKFKIN